MANDSNRRHVFVSHHHRDDEHVTKLTELLKTGGFDVRNSSIRVKQENQRRLDEKRVSDEVIRRLLRMKISWASKTIVLIGEQTHSRPWVDWEIEQSNKQGKQIIGVYVRGGTEANIPPALEKYATSIVAWNTQSIMDALDGSNNQFQSPDGSQRPQQHVKTTSNC